MGYTPPPLEVRKVTGGYSLYPPDYTTTDDLTIYANGTDTYPNIVLNGNNGLSLKVAAGWGINFNDAATIVLTLSYATPDVIFTPLANKNLWLKPSGTGKIKVAGTATGTGDVAINGHFDILDEAGATIKLATVA